MLYNINRDGERDPKGADWWDFFTEWKPESVESEDAMLNAMLMWTKATEDTSH